jgi:hypothetical protein
LLDDVALGKAGERSAFSGPPGPSGRSKLTSEHVPAGFEPATRGVEILYSSRFLILIEKPKVTSVRPATG